MKKIDYIIVFAAAAALTACNGSDNAAADYSSDPTAVTLAASVGDISTSRSNPAGLAGETTTAFKSSDVVAVSNDGGSAFVQYTLGTDGATWTPESSKYLTWNASSMNFKGYYPATAGTSMTAFSTPLDQSEYHTGTAKDIALADWMTFDGNCTRPAGGTAVQLTFSRKTARVIVVVDDFKDQFSSGTKVADVRICGTADGTQASSIVPYAKDGATGAEGSTYMALLPAGSAAAALPFVTLTANGTALSVMGIPALKAGTSYTYHLTVGKNTLKVNSVEVKDWQTGATVGGDSDESGSTLTLTSDMYLSSDNYALLYKALSVEGELTLKGPMTSQQLNDLSSFVRVYAKNKVKVIDISGITGLTDLSHVFEGSYLEKAVLPTTVTNIDYAFYNCTKLTNNSVTGLDNVTSAFGAFSGCTAITKPINMPKLTTIDQTYYQSGIQTFSSSIVTTITDSSFFRCTNLTSFTCNLATSLAASLFYGCTNLKEIHLEAPSFTNVESYSLVQGGNTYHMNPFQGFDAAAATLYLNASQAANITATPTACSWEPLGKGKTGSGNNCQVPIDLSGFKAVYCGTTKVYGN